MVTNQFNFFNAKLGQCNWYSYSMEIQQMLVIFIAEAQRPTNIRGFGNRLCARDTFKRVNSKEKLLIHQNLFKKWFFFFRFVLDTSIHFLLFRDYASNRLKSVVYMRDIIIDSWHKILKLHYFQINIVSI